MLKLPCMLKAQFKHHNRRLWINFFWSVIRGWPFSPTHALAVNKMTVGVDRVLWKQFDRETTAHCSWFLMTFLKIKNWHKIKLIVLKKKKITSPILLLMAYICLCHSCNRFLKISAAEKASLNSKVSWNLRLLLLLLPSTTIWANLFPPRHRSVLCVPWCTHTLLCYSALSQTVLSGSGCWLLQGLAIYGPFHQGLWPADRVKKPEWYMKGAYSH